jgi:hypothetical protein
MCIPTKIPWIRFSPCISTKTDQDPSSIASSESRIALALGQRFAINLERNRAMSAKLTRPDETTKWPLRTLQEFGAACNIAAAPAEFRIVVQQNPVFAVEPGNQFANGIKANDTPAVDTGK